MSSLAEKLRLARETRVEVDGHHFTIRRPTEAERMEWMGKDGITPLDLVRRCVVAWDLLETDLLAGGAPVPATFDAELFAEYINDKLDYWLPLSNAIQDAISARIGALDDAKKN